MLAKVVLVIILSAVPRRGWLDARSDWTFPTSRRVDTRDDTFRDLPLLLSLRKYRRAVLRSDVVALAVERRRIMKPEEPALQQFLETENRRVESHADRFRVSGLAVVRVLISRVLEVTARVAHFGFDHSGNIAQDILDTPEATASEDGDLNLLRGRLLTGTCVASVR